VKNTQLKWCGFKSLETLNSLQLSNICFDVQNSSTIFDKLPRLNNLELISCSNPPSPFTNLLAPLKNLEHLTLVDFSHLSNSVQIPQTLKHLVLKRLLKKEKIDARIFQTLPASLISLKIECDETTHFIHEFAYDDPNLMNPNLFSSDLPNLRRLEIGNTPIAWHCWARLTNLSELVCTHLLPQRGHSDFEALRNLVNLKTLHLTHCWIFELPANVFITLTKLKSLYLNENELDELTSEAFNGLEKLQVLDLTSNYLSRMDLDKWNALFGKLKCLRSINLFKCDIHDRIYMRLSELKISTNM
jgi:Leucine-rich repeat (LRR) protein